MTSFTRKLHSTNPSAAQAIHRMRYGKHTTLLAFTMGDRQDAEIEAEFTAVSPRRAAHLDVDYNDDPAQELGLTRWADRRFR